MNLGVFSSGSSAISVLVGHRLDPMSLRDGRPKSLTTRT
jgi:hypothetical protein